MPPLLYYAMLAALVIACISLPCGALTLTAIAGLAWAAMTLWLTVRRLTTTFRTPTHVAEMLWTSAIIPYLSIYWRIRGAFKFRVLFV